MRAFLCPMIPSDKAIRRMAGRVASRTCTWWAYEDLVQAGHLAALGDASPLRIMGAMIDELRALFPGTRTCRDLTILPLDEHEPLSRDDPAAAAERLEASQRLSQLIRRLKPEYRAIAELMLLGVSQREIAVMRGVSEASVSLMVRRIIRQLKPRMH